jgi:hypothetical protein
MVALVVAVVVVLVCMGNVDCSGGGKEVKVNGRPKENKVVVGVAVGGANEVLRAVDSVAIWTTTREQGHGRLVLLFDFDRRRSGDDGGKGGGGIEKALANVVLLLVGVNR